MFSIGDFAALGRVSVRMLRHYDVIGLLTPAKTDPASGYRYYQADQLRRLNRIIALKDLGLTLGQVAAILDDKVSTEELHGMLRLRRAQLEAQLTADTARLVGVEARLRMIEEEGHMNTEDVVLKHAGPRPVDRRQRLQTGGVRPGGLPAVRPGQPRELGARAPARGGSHAGSHVGPTPRGYGVRCRLGDTCSPRGDRGATLRACAGR